MVRGIGQDNTLAEQPPTVIGGLIGSGKKKTKSAKRLTKSKQRARDIAAAGQVKTSNDPSPFETLDIPALESDSDSDEEISTGRDMGKMSKSEQALAILHMQYCSIVKGTEDDVQRVFPHAQSDPKMTVVFDRRRKILHAVRDYGVIRQVRGFFYDASTEIDGRATPPDGNQARGAQATAMRADLRGARCCFQRGRFERRSVAYKWASVPRTIRADDQAAARDAGIGLRGQYRWAGGGKVLAISQGSVPQASCHPRKAGKEGAVVEIIRPFCILGALLLIY